MDLFGQSTRYVCSTLKTIQNVGFLFLDDVADALHGLFSAVFSSVMECGNGDE